MKRLFALMMTLIMALSFAMTAQGEDLAAAANAIIEGKTFERTYNTYFSSSYSSFNYYSTAYATVREIVANCIDGLVEPDIYGVYVPSLAESWETNEDQTVWTFKIGFPCREILQMGANRLQNAKIIPHQNVVGNGDCAVFQLVFILL